MRTSVMLAFALVGCQRPEVASADIDVGETSSGPRDPGEDPSISSTSASSLSATSPSDDDSGATTQAESSTPTSSGDSSTTSSSDASDAESSSSDGDSGAGELPEGDYICATLITDSGINPIAGSVSGRLALHVNGGSVEIADVGEDCEWNVISTFQNNGSPLRMSGDGTRLLSIEKWSENGDSARDGTRIYELPSGDLLWGARPTLISSVMGANEVSHDGSVLSMFWGSSGILNCYAGGAGFGGDPLDGYCNVPPKIAPSGDYIVASVGGGIKHPDLSGSVTTIYGADGAIADLDGVVHGFVDADHVLVSRYGDWDGEDFLGSAIVAMDGSSVATTNLPDIQYLSLVTDGEVIGHDGRIYDVYSETLLWAPSRGGKIAAAGPNHLLWSTGVHVYLLRWR